MKTHSPSTTVLTNKTKNLQKSKGHLSSPAAISVILGLIIAGVAFASFSVSASRKASGLNSPKAGTGTAKRQMSSRHKSLSMLSVAPGVLPTPTPTPTPDEAIATFEVVSSACTATPKTTFVLGEQVCARVTNAPIGARRVNWVGTEGFVRQTADVTSDPFTNIFTLPTGNTSVIEGITVDNRGIWTASLNSTDNTTRTVAYFNVSDPANAAADLVVYNLNTSEGAIPPGSNTGFFLWLSNDGPDEAANVDVSMAVPVNMTYIDATESSAFSCAESEGVVHCTVATWASGATATITLNFSVSGAAPNGIISTTANISSDTNDPRPESNSSQADVEISSPGAPPPTCALGCSGDIVATADSVNGSNQPGTTVNYAGSVEVSGECGTITYTPASGSFFTVGTHSVSVTSGGTTGGSCSFTVTVLDTPAPTISCPPDQTVQAASGQSTASVNPGTATATGTGVTVSGTRSDSQIRNDDGTFTEDLDDPYPIGTTIITWTATDSDQRTATCTQQITVTSADAPTISCPSDKTFTAASGECTYTATSGQIGSPTTGGTDVTVTSRRSDDLPLTDPYPAGQTLITWTATNDFGSASCTQKITVNANDNQAPTLNVPPDVNVTTDSCSALIDDELGVATAEDNCTASVNITRAGIPQTPCPTPGNPNRTCDSFVFPTGTTIITYTATDASGNSTTGTQNVTVTESPAVPPTIEAPADVTLYTGANATACSVTVTDLDATLGTASADDNCPGVTVARSNVPAGNTFPLGNTTVTYTATDRSGNTANDQQVVTVVDNTPPVITCPANITQNTDPGLCSALVNPGTATATDNCDSNPTVVGTRSDSLPLNAPYPKGTTTITWTATDHATPTNNQSSCTQTITVEDHEAPVITTNGVTPVLWPANHAYHTFNVTNFVTAVTDNCDVLTVGNVVIEKVTSDETENGGGDGNTNNDIIIAADCKSVQVRAERRNSGDGRVYTIHFKVTDLSGNVGRKTATIHAPKNLGNHTVDSGPNYTVNGTCP